MAQKWEYKFIKAERNPIIETDKDSGVQLVKKYENELTLSEDHKPLEYSIEVLSVHLGLDGWELVTILPRSLAISIRNSRHYNGRTLGFQTA